MNKYQKEMNKRDFDDADRQEISTALKDFYETSDRNMLKKITIDMFPYEKKYMPRYDKDCDILISTVGMQEPPIILSFLAMQPKKGILLHTKKSEKIADLVVNDSTVSSLNIKFEKIEIDEVNAAKNYNILKDEVLKQLGKEKVWVDPTGGRKIMGTAVGSFAFFFRIPMIYLHAEEKVGINVPFTGQIHDIENPYEYYGDIELSLLKKHFDNYEFDSALKICIELREMIKDPSLYAKLEMISELVEIYRDWDAFLHSKYYIHSSKQNDETKLLDRLLRIKNKFERFNFAVINDNHLQNNITFLQELDRCWLNKKNICDKYRLIDLYLNARRRAEGGKFDDATARLYRCMEMCSTIELSNSGIEDPTKPDYEIFAKKIDCNVTTLPEIFRSKAKYDIPSRLALDNQMVLLSIAGNKVANMYFDMKKSTDAESTMDKRNRSILAHGTNPIIEKDYENMESKVRSIVIMTVGDKDFKKLEKQAMFPNIMI